MAQKQEGKKRAKQKSLLCTVLSQTHAPPDKTSLSNILYVNLRMLISVELVSHNEQLIICLVGP